MRLPELLVPSRAALEALGFTALGSHEEQAIVGGATVHFDYVRQDARAPAFASLHQSAERTARVDFWTPTEGGGYVVTSNYPRPGVERPGHYRAGGLAGAPLERVYKAHQKRVEPFVVAGDFSWEGRVALASAWHATFGRAELRRQNLPGLLWCIAAVAILLSAVGAWARSLK